MAGVGVALRDQTYEIAYIPFLDLVNALGAPIREQRRAEEDWLFADWCQSSQRARE